MASAGQAHAHSSQPIHFSSPSGHRLSWWWPWNRGAVGFFTSGYSTVSTFLNISWKVTPNPLIGLRKSSTCDLLRGGSGLLWAGRQAGAVVVRQVERRHRGRGVPGLPGERIGYPWLGRLRGRLYGGVPQRALLGGVVPRHHHRDEQHEHDTGHDVDGGAVEVQLPRADDRDEQDPHDRQRDED